jgi:hypothetical protein
VAGKGPKFRKNVEFKEGLRREYSKYVAGNVVVTH